MTPETSCVGKIDGGGALMEGRRGQVISGTWNTFGIRTDLQKYHGGEHRAPRGNGNLVGRDTSC